MPVSNFVEIAKVIIWKGTKCRIVDTILKEKNKIGGLTLLDWKLSKKLQCGTGQKKKQNNKKRHTENWNRIDTPETDSHKYSQGERIVFSINGAGTIANLYAKKKI